MPLDLSRFESLGANCEFGFVLRHHGIETGSLLRWAEVTTIEALVRGISTNFENFYEFENLKPFNPGMVIDTLAKIAWHSNMKSRFTQGESDVPKLEFIANESERRSIWKVENAKISHLMQTTRISLQSSKRIFVFRPIKGFVDLKSARDLFSAIRLNGRSHLLIVNAAQPGQKSGIVDIVEPGLMMGLIDRLAPGDRTDDFSLEGWDALCRNAYFCAQDFAF